VAYSQDDAAKALPSFRHSLDGVEPRPVRTGPGHLMMIADCGGLKSPVEQVMPALEPSCPRPGAPRRLESGEYDQCYLRWLLQISENVKIECELTHAICQFIPINYYTWG